MLANDGDREDLDLDTLEIVEEPQHGDAEPTDEGLIELETQPGYRGADEFTYEICDFSGACSQATVTLNIT